MLFMFICVFIHFPPSFRSVQLGVSAVLVTRDCRNGVGSGVTSCVYAREYVVRAHVSLVYRTHPPSVVRLARCTLLLVEVLFCFIYKERNECSVQLARCF